MSDQRRPHSVGETGGLPGDNTDPRAHRITENEMADTVSMGGVARPADEGTDTAVAAFTDEELAEEEPQ